MTKKMTKKEFLQTIEDFLSRTKMSVSTFGVTTIGSPNLVYDLRKGRECREETQNRVLKFINTYEEKKIMEKLDIYDRHQLLFELLNKFGERGFELFEKSCALIERRSEPGTSDPETTTNKESI